MKGVFIATVLGVLVAGYAWYRALTFAGPTGPQRVEWFDAQGNAVESTQFGYPLGNGLMIGAIVLGDRLIVPTSGPTARSGGLAWISPAQGQAKIAWPYEGSDIESYAGIAVRDLDTFAVMVDSGTDDKESLSIGIAGKTGWNVAPVVAVEWTDKRGRPIVLAMSFVGADVEAVITHPTGDDVFGATSPVDIVRISSAGVRTVRSQPLGCTPCWALGALPTAKGWSVVARDLQSKIVLSDGAAAVEPSALQWWAQSMTDRIALGTTWGSPNDGENRVELDGSLAPPLVPPIAGWTPVLIGKQLVWIDGVVRYQWLWGRTRRDIDILAHRVGTRTIFTRSIDEDLQLVGASPDTLVPVIHNSTSFDFRIGAFLPRAGGGHYWVTGQGEYVTLDDQLNRVDPLSLRHHLRTRGSVGDFIDEPQHVWKLGWALFGFPILGLVGLVLAWSKRESPGRLRLSVVATALGLYVATGGICLLLVLPLL